MGNDISGKEHWRRSNSPFNQSISSHIIKKREFDFTVITRMFLNTRAVSAGLIYMKNLMICTDLGAWDADYKDGITADI